MKKCRGICGLELPEERFGPDNRGNKDGLKTRCVECQREFMKKYNGTAATKRSQRAYQLKQYGLTLEDYDALLAAQGGACGVCGGPPTTFDVYVVDHDHDTGEVRGLLCQHCNVGLGRFHDSSVVLGKASEYIKSSKTNKFRELEFKLLADGIPLRAFMEWMLDRKDANKYTCVEGQDVYWEKDGAVIRHRLAGEFGGELTVKCRTSTDGSIEDRVEVDLLLSKETPAENVVTFMKLCEFTPLVMITKKSHIFRVQDECEITVVYYEVHDDIRPSDPSRAFIEVEIDKNADIKISKAKEILDKWKSLLQASFVAPQSSLSLYEVYTDNRYQTV